MDAKSTYELIDFGDGRKLEKFGSVLLDRICPAAEGESPADVAGWAMRKEDLMQLEVDWYAQLDARGELIESLGNRPEGWRSHWGVLEMSLKLTPFGHVGVFPEQAQNWREIHDFVTSQVAMGKVVRMLNLFGYTGGSTLAAAEAGANCVHIDASEPAVAWSRKNAELNGLSDRPIRWIVEDAAKFAAREIKRGKAYELIVLDPPSFGTGPKGQRWEIQEHLAPLLQDCLTLLIQGCETTGVSRMVLSAHSLNPGMAEVKRDVREMALRSVASDMRVDVGSRRLCLTDRAGRKLDAGYVVILELSS